MVETQPAILLLGNTRATEMRAIAECVRNESPVEFLRQTGNIADARQIVVSECWFPDLIVALQSWSDEFPADEVLDLLAVTPLARLVCVYGPWCDSDGRNRAIWPQAARVPMSEAPDRIRVELAALRKPTATPAREHRGESSRSIATLPLTASRAEAFVANCSRMSDLKGVAQRIAVVSPERPLQRMLSTAIRQAGGNAVEIDDSSGPEIVVWDADPWDHERAAELNALRSRLPEASIIAAVALPHPALVSELRESGANSVWFKLAPLRTLLALLESCRPSTARHA